MSAGGVVTIQDVGDSQSDTGQGDQVASGLVDLYNVAGVHYQAGNMFAWLRGRRVEIEHLGATGPAMQRKVMWCSVVPAG